MKIAIFHELDYGGARRTVNELAKRLRKNNIVDLFIVNEVENREEKFFYNEVFFNKFVPKKWSKGNWKIRLYKDTIELYKLYKLHKIISKDINKKNYDFVFIHPSQFTQSPFILRFIKTKKIYYCQEPLRIVHDPLIASLGTTSLLKRQYESVNRLIRKYIDRKNITWADYILVNSKNTQNAVNNAYGLKSFICYFGVDSNLFKPIKIKKNYDLLFIGNKDEKSGYLLLCSSIALMNQKPKVYIKFRDSSYITDDELNKLYNKSKIVVTLTLNEPFGLIPLEAMACRVPIIAVNEGGYKETVIHNKTGFLVPRDPKIIAQKLDWLLTNHNVAKKMGENGRKVILKKWTWEITIKRLKELLRNFKLIAN